MKDKDSIFEIDSDYLKASSFLLKNSTFQDDYLDDYEKNIYNSFCKLLVTNWINELQQFIGDNKFISISQIDKPGYVNIKYCGYGHNIDINIKVLTLFFANSFLDEIKPVDFFVFTNSLIVKNTAKAILGTKSFPAQMDCSKLLIGAIKMYGYVIRTFKFSVENKITECFDCNYRSDFYLQTIYNRPKKIKSKNLIINKRIKYEYIKSIKRQRVRPPNNGF